MRRLSISARLYALVTLVILALVAAMTLSLLQSQARLVEERKAMLSAMDEAAVGIFQKYFDLEQKGVLTREAAQAGAMEAVRAMRYQDAGYFFISDMQARMLMHPLKPELIGKDLSGLQDKTGKAIFKEFTATVKAQGQGFVDYYWPKPGVEEPVLKLSHVIGFKPWDWFVGTGVYADDLDALFRAGMIQLGIVCAAASALTLSAALLVVRSVVRPLVRLKGAMRAIAREDLSEPVPETGRGDEIGEMAEALSLLRDSVEDRVTLRQREQERQAEIDNQRDAAAAQLREQADRQARSIATLGTALEALSSGDLTPEIGTIASDYAKLRTDFNTALAALRHVIGAINGSTDIVFDSAGGISEAASNLSRRTEQQAAALEETAAALNEITTTVLTASERAREARDMVAATKASAARSGDIVRNAVAAMGRIENSSSQIGRIIGVIDEIAFQTNLLALNAGVEAARAGEAGRGFAVVAQEVRELAQRSAQAAKEIKDLIRGSSSEVEAGVALVRSTGDALSEIENLVNAVNDHVASIAQAAQEQATSLQEVNQAVNSMDQMTQQNAAMVEETSAASQTLARESEELRRLLRTFRLERNGGHARAA